MYYPQLPPLTLLPLNMLYITLPPLNMLYITLPYVSLKLFHWEPYWAVVVVGYIHTVFSYDSSTSPSVVTLLWPPTQAIHLDLISHSLAFNLSAFPLTCVEN